MIVDITSEKDLIVELAEFKSLVDLKVGAKLKILSADATLAFKDNKQAKLCLTNIDLDEPNKADKELRDLTKRTDPEHDQATGPQVDADDF